MTRINLVHPTARTALLAMLSGILIGTSYIPFPPWAIFFGFLPIWWVWVHAKSGREIFFFSWLAQAVFTLIGFNWVAHTLEEFGHLPRPIAILGLALFCGFANLFLPLAGVIWWQIKNQFQLKPKIAALLLFPVTSLAHWLIPTIFTWNFGYTWLWAKLPGFQLADLIGFWGLSHFTVFVNLLLFIAIHFRLSALRRMALAASATSLVLVTQILGENRTHQFKSTPETYVIAQIIQANIGNQEKQYAEKGLGFRSHILDRYLSIMEEGKKHLVATERMDLAAGKVPKLKFSIWPETAFPDLLGPLHKERVYARRLHNYIRENKSSLILGAYSMSQSNQKATNSILMIDENSNYVGEAYNKTHLLAFGEYIPFGDTFPILKRWLPQVADFARGPGPTVMDFHGVKIGQQICYESLFPEFSIELANRGSEILVNVTNDSWYGTWQQPYQHLYMTLARAVELRRPLIRSTNTGISTVILASGQILEQSPMGIEWQSVYRVPYIQSPPPTFYQSYPWLTPTLLVIFGSFLVVFGRRRKDSATMDF